VRDEDVMSEDVMSGDRPTPDRILGLINGYWATGILGVAASHALFTRLETGTDTAEKLAVDAGISRRGAQALLDGLVGLGLVEVHEGRYRNTPEAAAFLVEGRPDCLGDFAQLKLSHVNSLGALPEVVASGAPVRATVEVADNPHWETLVTALAAQSVPVARLAAETLRLADAGEISILDIGGGSGVFSAVWLGLNPTARATQLDWAPINAIARRLVAERGVADRFTCVDGDLHTTDYGTAAHDLVVYSNIAHQEGEAQNTEILTRIRAALKPGGTLVISDYVVDDDRSGPPFALVFAAEMLLKSKDGRTWRQADYQAWLGAAGFQDVTFVPTSSPATLILAR
jgi:2-polyprenyl-3-methyl-5-hydroxy-6-metoxy-1,4-benzoquinol methylase